MIPQQSQQPINNNCLYPMAMGNIPQSAPYSNGQNVPVQNSAVQNLPQQIPTRTNQPQQQIPSNQQYYMATNNNQSQNHRSTVPPTAQQTTALNQQNAGPTVNNIIVRNEKYYDELIKSLYLKRDKIQEDKLKTQKKLEKYEAEIRDFKWQIDNIEKQLKNCHEERFAIVNKKKTSSKKSSKSSSTQPANAQPTAQNNKQTKHPLNQVGPQNGQSVPNNQPKETNTNMSSMPMHPNKHHPQNYQSSHEKPMANPQNQISQQQLIRQQFNKSATIQAENLPWTIPAMQDYNTQNNHMMPGHQFNPNQPHNGRPLPPIPPRLMHEDHNMPQNYHNNKNINSELDNLNQGVQNLYIYGNNPLNPQISNLNGPINNVQQQHYPQKASVVDKNGQAQQYTQNVQCYNNP